MSNSSTLDLNKPEETVVIDIRTAVARCKLPHHVSPISDYFSYTQSLISRFIREDIRSDPTALSLLLLGIVSAAEFYFRSVITQTLSICPCSIKHSERVQIPLASLSYYGTETSSLGLSIFEHKSLAGSDEIKNEVQRLLGIAIPKTGSVATALTGFDTLCELRHAAIHTRGYISSKAASDLGIYAAALQQIDMAQAAAFDLTKLSHNAVRSLNRFLTNAILERWKAQKILTGVWVHDKKIFTRFFNVFVYPEESAFSNDVRLAYRHIQNSLVARGKAG